MKVRSFGLTDTGKKRSANEDSFLISEDQNLFVVADGMGGHSGGEFASKMAVQTIEEVIQGINEDPEATVISGVTSDEADFGDRLKYSIEMASSRIYDRSIYDSALKGMGTTTVAVLLQDKDAYVANVGDSRAYLVHANKIEQITTDHSLVNEQVQAGVISEEDAKKHRLKNIITRSVGYQEEVEPDLHKIEIHMGDKILLCSDGLSNLVDDKTMEAIINGHDLNAACQKLVDKANELGGDDNITAVLLEVTEL